MSALLEWVDLLSCWDKLSSRSMPYVLGKFTFYFNTGSEGDIESVRINGVSVLSRLNSLMHVYVTQANFTTKPRFEIKNKRSFTEMNSQGSRVEKNTHAQKVQMQKILFTNEACWWNLLVWRNHA